MKIIYLIIGLPGSGKTTIMNKFKRVYLIDDMTSISQLPENTTKRMAISDPYFCRKSVLDSAISILKKKYPEHIIKFIEFENDKHKAIQNAEKREGKKVKKLIEQLSKDYKPKIKNTLKIRT